MPTNAAVGPCRYERLDERILLSSTWIEGSIGSIAVPQAISARAVTIPGSSPTVLDSTSPIGYTPQQIRHAYGFDQIPLNGAGMTIAIIDPCHDPNALSDLQQFDRHVEAQVIPDPPSFTQVNEFGQTSNYPTNQDASLSIETSLDIEWAHAIAPDASILLVEFNATPLGGGSFSAYSSDITNAINTARNYAGVVAVSMSFGGPLSLSDSTFTTPSGHSGVTFLASSGDSGGAAGSPATSPNVVSVGGTVLPLDAAGDYPGTGSAGEVAWSGGSGGLTSASQPAYQKGVVTQSTTARTNPDVAYNAGYGVAVYDSWADSTAPWMPIGGTSAGCPQWAALIALADQGRSQAGLATLDGASQTLPLLYHLPSSAFHDIVYGSNAHFSAGAGYDLVTGRGSPVASQVVAGLSRPFTVASGGSVLYQLDSTGNLWEYNSAGWQVIDTGVTSFAFGPSYAGDGQTDLYFLQDIGYLWRYNGSFTEIDSGVTSFAFGPSYAGDGQTNLYFLQDIGYLWRYNGGYYVIDGGVTSFAFGPSYAGDGQTDLYFLQDIGYLTRYNGGYYGIAGGVTSFAFGPSYAGDGQTDLYFLQDIGYLTRYNGGYYGIAGGVTSFAFGPSYAGDGQTDLYFLQDIGYLTRYNGGYYGIAGGVTSFAFGPSYAGDGQTDLYFLQDIGYLTRCQRRLLWDRRRRDLVRLRPRRHQLRR